MDKTTVLTVLVAAMVLVSLFQTVQILNLTSAVSNGGASAGTALATAKTTTLKVPVAKTTGSTGTSGSTNLNNLPSMVGGC